MKFIQTPFYFTVYLRNAGIHVFSWKYYFWLRSTDKNGNIDLHKVPEAKCEHHFCKKKTHLSLCLQGTHQQNTSEYVSIACSNALRSKQLQALGIQVIALIVYYWAENWGGGKGAIISFTYYIGLDGSIERTLKSSCFASCLHSPCYQPLKSSARLKSGFFSLT